MRMMVRKRKRIGWMEMEEVENIAASHIALGKVLPVIGKVSVIALYEFSSTYMIQFNSIKFVHEQMSVPSIREPDCKRLPGDHSYSQMKMSMQL